jgi:VWFA-related protein
MTRAAVPITALMVVTAAPARTQETPVFRTAADAVVIDVSVLEDGRPVAGLTAEDFELVDNDVAQAVLSAEPSTMPLDISLVADLSSSIVDGWTGGAIFARNNDAGTWLEDGLNAVVSMLEPDDRLRLLETGSVLRTAAGNALPSGALGTAGKSHRSALFDAVTLAVIQRAEPGRRRLVIAMTDGHDTSSITDFPTRARVLARSDAVLQIVTVGVRAPANLYSIAAGDHPLQYTPPPDRAPSPFRRPLDWYADAGNYDWVWKDIARRTGGRFWATTDAGDFVPQLRQIVQEFRSRYLLRYIPTGVRREGWHDVEVRVKRERGWDVHARRGYFVGG